MEENETVTDVTDVEEESESNFPTAFVIGLGAGVLSTLATWKIVKRWKKSKDADIVTGEVVDETTPPAPPATS